MIPLKQMPWQGDGWTDELAAAVTNPHELLARLELSLDDPQLPLDDLDCASDFPMRVPLPFVERMRHGDPDDPLLRQVLPRRVERVSMPGWVADPLAEAAATRAPGLIQKYHGRVLLIATPVCAVHCRYCFRREFPYDAHQHAVTSEHLAIIEQDPTISEVILSGGDPLMLKDVPLERLVNRLEAMPQLRRLRIHTRLPVVIPARVTLTLCDLLRRTRFATTLVLHVNHPNEIAGEFPDALAALAAAGITLLNQSVLLAGVNDTVEVLDALSQRLFEHRVLPYYLHLPDRVAGTHHFDVTEARGRMLVDALSRRLPGYLVPRLAREVPGAPAKQILGGA
jgi:EF-P beta-lysylation protein EpmB